VIEHVWKNGQAHSVRDRARPTSASAETMHEQKCNKKKPQQHGRQRRVVSLSTNKEYTVEVIKDATTAIEGCLNSNNRYSYAASLQGSVESWRYALRANGRQSCSIVLFASEQYHFVLCRDDGLTPASQCALRCNVNILRYSVLRFWRILLLKRVRASIGQMLLSSLRSQQICSYKYARQYQAT